VTSIKKEFDKALKDFGVVEITPQLGEKVSLLSFSSHLELHESHFFDLQSSSV
jgi:hypothetical protein